MTNRGYAGYYKNVFLRSSYEFAYAKWLDLHDINWGYEQETYDLGYRKYVPDFFIYEGEKLSYVVEVKSNNTKEIKKALKALESLKTLFNIDGKIILYDDLKSMYGSLDISLNQAIRDWISSESTTIHKAIDGELNPHYGLTHREVTKQVIGESTKRRWSNPALREKMLEGARKGGKIARERFTGEVRKPREQRICNYCGKPYNVIVGSRQVLCGKECRGKQITLHGGKGNKIQSQRAQKVRDDVKSLITTWALDNKELVLGTPLNKIKTNLSPLLSQIKNEFNIVDFRIISKSVFGEDLGRKEFLKYLKELVSDNENIC